MFSLECSNKEFTYGRVKATLDNLINQQQDRNVVLDKAPGKALIAITPWSNSDWKDRITL